MSNLKPAVAALLLAIALVLPAYAQSAGQSGRLDQLFDELKNATPETWQPIENEIWAEWSHSGSAAMDLLLQRGREAMQRGDYDTAIEHFTALIDHAPEFAEGWNARATAYFHKGLYGPSIDDIRHTLALNPRHFGALSGLGMILEQIGDPKDALWVYQQAAAIHPQRPDLKAAIERLQKEVGGRAL